MAEPNFLDDFEMEDQKQSLWCWAATANSVKLFYNPGSNHKQCQVANKTLASATRCCPDPFPCNQTATLGDALGAVKKLNLFSPGTVPWQKLDDEIAAGKVVCVVIRWENGFGHCIAINGTGKLDDETEMVVVNDSAVGMDERTIKYKDLLSNYFSGDMRSGVWVDTYLTKKR